MFPRKQSLRQKLTSLGSAIPGSRSEGRRANRRPNLKELVLRAINCSVLGDHLSKAHINNCFSGQSLQEGERRNFIQ